MAASFSFGRADGYTNGPDAVTCVGTTLAGAAALPGAINNLTTSAGQVAAVLPANAAVGSPIIVRTVSATTATIFPPTAAGTINGGSAGAAFSVATTKTAMFFPHPNGVDYTAVLSA